MRNLAELIETISYSQSSHAVELLRFYQSSSLAMNQCLLWPPCVADADIIFLPCGFFLSIFYLFFIPRLISAVAQWISTILLHMVCELECRSEICCTRLATNTGRKNDAKNRHLGTIPQLCRAISSQLRHVSTIRKKNLLSSNISTTCPYNMVNFGPPADEIVSLVWGTPANFNGFCVLAALLHGI